MSQPAFSPRLDDEPDVYLLIPGQDSMGIKWREGLLQFKGRHGAAAEQQFGDHHVGRVDHWTKWSYGDLPAVYKNWLTGGGTPPRAAVHKVRAVRLIELAESGDREVPPNQRVGHGLACELTELTLEGEAWCSLGFEAFPDDALVNKCFHPTVARVLATLAEPVLTIEQSLSYPAWLSRRRNVAGAR